MLTTTNLSPHALQRLALINDTRDMSRWIFLAAFHRTPLPGRPTYPAEGLASGRSALSMPKIASKSSGLAIKSANV